jgi:hypothetical protein
VACTHAWRRRVLAGAALVLTMTAAACGSGGNHPTSASTTTHPANSVIGGSPSSAPSAENTGTGGNGGGGGSSGGGSGGGGSTTPTYPSDAKSYGLAFLQAMGQHDSSRLTVLAVQSVVGQVADNYYNVNTQWTNRSCGQDPNDPANPTKIACVYDNANGDEITLGLNKTQLGAPTAVLTASLEKTTYPTDPTSYVQGLFSAYQSGNINRVVRLSNSTVKGKLACMLSEGTTTDVPTAIDATYTSLTIRGATASTGGYYYTFKVLTSPGGKAGAVKDITAKACP